jgi:hypothetical protein
LSDAGVPSRGLLVRDPWIGLLLSGEKTWELRSRRTTFRGRFALIRSGTGLVVGEARLVDVVGPYSGEELRSSDRKHRAAAYVEANSGRFPSLYGWVVEGAMAYDRPVPYEHPQGAVIWVALEGRLRF